MRRPRFRTAPLTGLHSAKVVDSVFYTAVQAAKAAAILYSLTVYLSTDTIENAHVVSNRLQVMDLIYEWSYAAF
jgi:hypothetical protein